ncbi:winged helix-turn-helix transcriptional regulator [Gellertiella hungarica]|uniref:DNA-binding HxlR family transcriptional regulator n=1 Tax=Gellertiella hungarica TaxID=1572859 RepID=A0A7W6J859_9HYPH|nr:helix-turn-helix domain-containing protein [Gellertiella hungarica]MBB4066570.1 DNA-binding HxlR family transcriptional regulator [Gellertiella hungarica]
MPLKRRKNRTPTPLCPLSECMAVLGGAWTPNIIWYLSEGPRRFSELRSDIPLVSAKVLTQRLRELEDRGVIARNVMPTSPPSVEYVLTEHGAEFLPAIRAIVEVGHRLKQKRKPEAPPASPGGPTAAHAAG